MVFLLPFKNYDIESFPNVHVPLSEAPPRHPSVVAENERRRASMAGSVRSEDPEKKVSRGGSSSGFTLEELREEVDLDIAASGHDSSYDRKSKVINKAIQDIGMGSYQWRLFILCGFGWLADNLWLQGVALTLPSLSAEFGVSATHVRYTTLSLFCGLCCGAVFWGTASDIIGRRLAFNMTLFITGVFGLAVGGAHNWITACGLYAALGAGVGGNLPVDGALFLEFLPFQSGNLLTMLSVFWPVGQLLGSFFAWGFIPNYSCAQDLPACNAAGPGQACCTRSSNMGWRYLNLTMGAFTFFMFICRFFFFHLFESPKFLLSRGRQQEAVVVVHAIAYQNGKKTWLDEEVLNAIGGRPEEVTDMKLTTGEIIKRQLSKFSTQRIGPLFRSKKLGINTALLWFCWATIGMGYPLFNAFLPQYLTQVDPNAPPTPTSIVYRNYAITSVVGVPGSIIACYTVDVPYIGRKGTIATATLLTGIFLFVFTTSTSPSFQLAFTCLEAFFQNIMYGVLYAYTPEIFPAPNRGTGTGIASFLNRITGLCAPLVAINAGATDPKAPIYASGGLMLAAFIAMVCFPIETRGKQSL
jgi:MFS family permease